MSNNMYVIPGDQRGGGRVGPFETRRLIESGLILAATAYPTITSGLSIGFKAVIIAAVAAPLFLVTLTGINGDSLGQFIWHVLLFLVKRRKSVYRRVGKHVKTK